MNPAIYGVMLVGALCVGGLIRVIATATTEQTKYRSEFEALVKSLFPGCYLKAVFQARGSFGAEIHIRNRIFLLAGDYIPEEGGDGYMHAYEGFPYRGGKELFTVPLAGHSQHWPVLRKGALQLSEYLKNENRA